MKKTVLLIVAMLGIATTVLAQAWKVGAPVSFTTPDKDLTILVSREKQGIYTTGNHPRLTLYWEFDETTKNNREALRKKYEKIFVQIEGQNGEGKKLLITKNCFKGNIPSYNFFYDKEQMMANMPITITFSFYKDEEQVAVIEQSYAIDWKTDDIIPYRMPAVPVSPVPDRNAIAKN